ncbi:MAG: amino acid ABC transporter substrate-binding protein, partial [Microthrixaceae bacterium]|nr:amino acid ABC transporter substrate-binding protein [Microthrixaceae bacterium]
GSDATASPCDDSDQLRIGVSNTLTGPSAEIGEITLQGFELASQELNSAGGVLGRCVELVVKDDGGEPTKAAQVMRQLVDEDEVEAVLGPFLSSAMGATMEITNDAGLVPYVPQVDGGLRLNFGAGDHAVP